MRGKTPRWGNPTREREILLFSFRKVQNNNKYTFPAKENTSQHQNSPTKFCLDFRAKFVLLYDFLCTSIFVPTVSCTDSSVWPKNNKQKFEICLEIRSQNHLDLRAKFVLLYGLYRSVHYGLP
jgi:hypothetical protein